MVYNSMSLINKEHTIMYEISDKEWHTCKICQINVKLLSKKYGGSGKYYSNSFKKHIEIDHGISLEEYFQKYVKRPSCECGICKQLSNISVKNKNIQWKRYMCGRNKGVLNWSKSAKSTRIGSHNPMFGKTPWNKGLTKNTSDIVSGVSKKLTGKFITEKTRNLMKESAKKRIIHGHSGHRHTEDNKRKFKENAIRMIKDGKYKHTRTKPHIMFGEILKNNNIIYEEEKQLKYWSFDYYIPKYNVYIEVDGDYFHSNPKMFPNGPKTSTQKINQSRDFKKNLFCQENKITLIRFWEYDILNNAKDIECKLKELLLSNILDNKEH